MLNIAKYGVEFLGTFLFLSIILSTGDPIAIVVALLAMIYFGGKISGGNFNPAVSFMFWTKGDMSSVDFIFYVIAQLLGAYSAYIFYNKFIKK